MSIGKGHGARCAIGEESTFGTPVAVTELVPFSSEGLNRAIALIESEYLDGSPSRKGFQNGSVTVQGDISGEAVYDEIAGGIVGIEKIIKGAMGTVTRDSSNGLNQYTLSTEIDDHFTIAFNKQVSVWEIASAKIGTFELTGNAGEKLTFTAGNIIGHDLRRTGDTGIANTSSAIDSISPSNIPSNLLISDMIFRIGDQSNVLTSADEVCIESFTFSIDNKLSDPTFATGCSSNSDSDKTLEPLRNGIREISLKISLPRYETDQFFTWQNDGTALQADLKFTLGSYQFNILLPYVKIDETGAPISGAELIKSDYSFACLRNAGRNTYMALQDSTAITGEAAIEVKSARTTTA